MRWAGWFLAAIMASFALAPITVTAAGTSTGAWTTVAPMPTPRFALAAATGSDGRVYAIGGENGDTVLSTVEAFDPGANAWSRVAPMPTARAALAAVAGKDGRIYAIGGWGNQSVNDALPTVEAYDPQRNSWTAEAPMPTPRSGAAAAGPDGTIYVIGGCDALPCSPNAGLLSAVEAYSPTTNTWRTAMSMPIILAAASAATGTDGRIYVMGGCCKPGSGPEDKSSTEAVEIYAPHGGTWTSGPSMLCHRLCSLQSTHFL